MITMLKAEIRKLADPKKAEILQRFFKTGKGEYGEGDRFLGLTVPVQRQVARQFKDLKFKDLKILLNSKIHEQRLIALLILVDRFQKARNLSFPRKRESRIRKMDSRYPPQASDSGMTKRIFDFYLKHTKYINNWDLVDLSAPKIVGAYLRKKNKAILYRLATSKNLWERRIAILATFDFIYFGDPKDALQISKILMHDKHDLIHKAVGWMLREVGKRCSETLLIEFLNRHHKQMPRTMLRYSIERLPQTLRLKYLKRA